MSNQVEIKAEISDELVETLSDYFLETESENWGIMQGGIHDPYFVFGIFPDLITAAEALKVLRREFPKLPNQFEKNLVTDADWQNAYKQYIKPWNVRQLHWIPLWEQSYYEAPEGSAVVYIDAGMAFGTGAHETTRLCARRLLDYFDAYPSAISNRLLIDAGCGSGVLALSGAALGFGSVYAFDCDPKAILVCQNNCTENAHINPPNFTVAELEKGFSNGIQGDLVLANIQTDVLMSNSTHLVKSLKDSGTLVLSGILNKEIDLVLQHYSEQFKAFQSNSTISV
ncbi:MAG: 50S ribosomal protein L11 methyltransferase, partial [Verrucomicrobiota bacterium]|nr:50S ribosomal protein L11 methyltransferase [Verrucomicrobiota bacterium]